MDILSMDSSPLTIVVCKWVPDFYRALRSLNVKVFAVLDDFDMNVGTPDPELLRSACEHVYRISTFNSLEELGAVAADIATRGETVDRVFSLAEFSQYGAGYLDLLLRPGRRAPLDHVATRDKRMMKQRVREHGLRTTEWRSIPDPEDVSASIAAVRDLKFPVIVKPVAGLGTMSTVRVDTIEELPEVLREFAYEPALNGRQLMAEEYVDGRELHIDSVWVDGEAVFSAVCAYVRPRLEVAGDETVTVGPADGSYILPEEENTDLLKKVREMHAVANEALGIQTCATQLEVFVTADGELVFSELGARPGGAWAPDLLSAYIGENYWAALARLLVLGKEAAPPTHGIPRYLGVVHIVAEAPGVITALPDESELERFPGILDWRFACTVGTQVQLTHSSDWCLFLVLGADSLGEYTELCDQVARELKVRTAPA
jgi:biotin carboxylase